MALTAFPSLSKVAHLNDGSTYAYVHVPVSTPEKPTFLLLHGFPSSSWDWRHLIVLLKEAGYGVVAPDLLGYGDTDKPRGLEAYKMKRMSGHITEILDIEGLKKVIGVAHDWGSGLLSRLTNYHPKHFLAVVFISVGYIEPGQTFDIDAVNAFTEQTFGYPAFGYQKWFNTDEAAEVIDRNSQAAFSLIYPKDPEIWRTDLCPIDKASAWIAAGRTTPLPAWITEEENAIRNQIFTKGGYTAPLCWYKAALRGINTADEEGIPEVAKYLTLPTMLVVSTKDYATRADVQEHMSKKWVKNLRVETLDCGHWVQLEKRDELFGHLQSFADEVVAK